MGAPRTIDAGIPGPQASQSYTFPPGVTLDLEAVYVELDTSGAGGPVTAELVISEQSGVVIARKRQGQTVDAGGAGSATWALRLDDDGEGSGPPTGTLFEAVNSDTVTLPPNAGGPATQVPWTVVTDGGVWDYTDPTNPAVKHDGLLVVTLEVECHSATPMAPGETLFSQLLIPGPIGVFPGVMNLLLNNEATAANPAPSWPQAAAGAIFLGDKAVLALNNNGAAPVDVTYVIRSDLMAS